MYSTTHSHHLSLHEESILKNIKPEEKDIHLAIQDPAHKKHLLKIYDFLIKNNFSVYWNYKYNLKKSLSIANEKKVNFIIIIGENENNNSLTWALATTDVSTGEFLIREGKEPNNLHQELLKLNASEVICSENNIKQDLKWCPANIKITDVAKTPFTLIEAESSLKKYFKLTTK